MYLMPRKYPDQMKGVSMVCSTSATLQYAYLWAHRGIKKSASGHTRVTTTGVYGNRFFFNRSISDDRWGPPQPLYYRWDTLQVTIHCFQNDVHR